MLVAMPFRPIAGYFVGQSSTPVFNIVAAIFSLRKELSAKAEPYWNRETLRKFSSIFILFLLWTISSGIYNLVEATIIRQRLPDLDSAGYYIATRFSDIAGFLAATLAFTVFPFAAEQYAKGKGTRSITIKAISANAIFCAALAIPFIFFGRQILSLLPNGNHYAEYWWAIPWLIAITWLSSIYGFYSTTEAAASRFRFLRWSIPLNITYPAVLLAVTGHGYLSGFIPNSCTEFLSTHNIYSLKTMLCWMTAINVLIALACIIAMTRQHHRTRL